MFIVFSKRTQYANRYLTYYHDKQGCLAISARLPAEQGTVLFKSTESVRKRQNESQKDVPTGTFSEVTNDFDFDVSEPMAAQWADALALMAEAFLSGDAASVSS